MDPELLQTIFREASLARQNGADPQQVDALIRETTGLDNLPALATAARGGVPHSELMAQPDEDPAGRPGGLEQGLNTALRGATMGLSTPILQGIDALGLPFVGSDNADRHIAAVNAMREDHPIGAGALEVAAGIPSAFVGIGPAARLAKAGGRAAVGAATRGGAGTLGRAAAQTAGTAAGAGTVLAAEGALAGAGGVLGEGRGGERGWEDWGDVASGAATGALLSTILGGVGGTVAGAAAARKGLRETSGAAGVRLREMAEQYVGRDVPGIDKHFEELTKIKDSAYDKVLASKRNMPPGTGLFLAQDPQARSLLQNTKGGPQFLRDADAYLSAVRAGREPPGLPALPERTFIQAQRNAQGELDKIFRGGGNVELQEEIQEGIGILRNFRDQVPGLAEADNLHASLRAQQRAFDAGRAAANTPANEVEAAFAKLSGEEADAFRVGLARDFLQRLGGTRASVQSQFTRLLEGDEGLRKLQIMLGSREATDRFIREVRSAQRDLTIDGVAEKITKYLSFRFGKSSVLAGDETTDLLLDAMTRNP